MGGPRLSPEVIALRKITEAKWQRMVTKILREQGWWVFHNYDSRVSDSGLPDLIAIHPARRQYFMAELKREVGKLRSEQALCIALLRGVGVEVHEWRPSNEAEVRARSLL